MLVNEALGETRDWTNGFYVHLSKNLQLFLSRISAMVMSQIQLDFGELKGKMLKSTSSRKLQNLSSCFSSVQSLHVIVTKLSKAKLKNHKKIKTTFHCHQPTFLKTKFDQPLISTNQGRSIGNCILVTTVVRFMARFRNFFQRFTNCSSVFYVTLCF